MNLIVAVDKNWAIGLGNKLLTRIPQDMKYFREATKGKVVVMGRKTLESFPDGQPLKNRVNMVLTSNRQYRAEGAALAHSVEELQEALKAYDTADIYVIGGGSIYHQMLPYCDTAYVTKIDYAYQADTYFPDLDKDPGWEMTKISEEQTYFDLAYAFTVYERVGRYSPHRHGSNAVRA